VGFLLLLLVVVATVASGVGGTLRDETKNGNRDEKKGGRPIVLGKRLMSKRFRNRETKRGRERERCCWAAKDKVRYPHTLSDLTRIRSLSTTSMSTL
jgi:hypothetical protein